MKKSTRDTIIFCIICGLSATLVLIIFTIKRVDDPKSEMTKEEENEGFQSGCQYWHFTNDQVCDDEANTEECNFDFDDLDLGRPGDLRSDLEHRAARGTRLPNLTQLHLT